MSGTAVLSSGRIQVLFGHIEKDPYLCRKRLILDSHYTRQYIEAGSSFQCDHGPVTLLCVVDPEVWYFHGGLVYFVNKLDFINIISRGRRNGGSGAMEIPVERAMTPMEVEFVLGIVSAVGPLECWMIVGSDLTRFILRNRKRIDEWILRVASLLLARMVLKKYARSLYQKISMALTDGAWSNLSETTATDDAFIARFTGRLLGTYKSDAVMDEALTMRWSASLGILKGLETLVSISSGTDERTDTGVHARAEDLVKSLQELGLGVSSREVHSLLHVIHCHPHEISNAINVLNAAFESSPRSYTNANACRQAALSPF